MNVELRPHIGTTDDGREVVIQQDQIFVDGRRYGYVPYAPVPPLLWIRRPNAAIESAVKKLVKDRGDIPGRKVEVPSLTSEDELDELEGVNTRRQRDDDV